MVMIIKQISFLSITTILFLKYRKKQLLLTIVNEIFTRTITL